MSDVTQILVAIDRGDVRAADKLLPVVYQELRRLAAQQMNKESPGQTLQATALVHEAYLRLVGAKGRNWDGRAHFFAAAAEAMRRILIDNARRKKRLMHGGDRKKVTLNEAEFVIDAPSDDLIALDEALKKLTIEDPVKAELVKLRYFAGLTVEEAAKMLKISRATADRYWSYARAWLFHEMTEDSGETPC